nr:tigger transposable element-derived protein 4-like [Dermacentor andersoni]
MATPAKRLKYEAKDLATKVEILRALKDGLSRQEAMKKYDVKRSTLSTYVKNEEQILQAFESEKFRASRKRLRTAAHPELEEALLRWVVDSRNANLPLSGPLIMAQAERFALMMHIDAFKASEGWCARFRERHGLIFKTVCGERGAVNEDVANNWKNAQLLEHIAAYDPNDIFKADETALFFKALPDKTVTMKGDPCIGSKRSKERVTILLAANMTGTECWPLVVIGKAQKPRCFKNMPALPVEYRAIKKAWVTSEIFRGWMQKLDRQFSAKNPKVLMVLDNCSTHNSVTGLGNIEVVFLPPNTTSALQPMDQGIIQYVKTKYRRRVLERMLLCHEVGKQYDVNLLSAVNILAYVWHNTPAHVVANCFRHSGFVVREPGDDAVAKVSLDDNGDDCEDFGGVLPDVVTLADYVGIDDGVVTAGSLTEEEIPI